ncbi:Forkhead box protein K2 [Caligus rogercresseyi]|uniref:Forkhead box protein K2 n=1 Tax=Caligus rogercresseyi TaxID=217165 RepID=A0A7T8KI24_CALRO|nr:Forkhead box protein K2 [Caligus rogercresseyi]|eukprot:TRINITY_DN21724_c0_g1_i1.p1 TRINITY_DN21724_c0_g1~~TRINITY_DN21724_c0_g1_i1.p1  ORF type:complete len:302 (-),score=148.54 TRINITY_DN21724_c0_g1_i1:48-953(-)
MQRVLSMDPHFKIELTCDVPDIMNEEIVIEDNGVEVATEEVEAASEEMEFLERDEGHVVVGEEVAYVEEEEEEEDLLDPDWYYEEAYIADGEDLSDKAGRSILDAGNTDLQTAIDLAKFSEQGKESSSRPNSSPQRYIILQYPLKSSSSSPKSNSKREAHHSYSSGSASSGADLDLVNVYGKPKLSYAAMITEVIRSAPKQRLTLNEIYLAISSRYPYYKMDSKNWQNSIRHNLSLNHSFVKIPRPENKGRGHFWTIDYSKDKSPAKAGGKMNSSQEFITPNHHSKYHKKYHIFNVSPSTV